MYGSAYGGPQTIVRSSSIAEVPTATSAAPRFQSRKHQSGSTNQVKWCADSANGLQPFGLYRQVGTSCTASTGVKRASSLNTNLVFSNPTCTVGTRPQLSVTLPVNANFASGARAYTLSDTITERNAAVC